MKKKIILMSLILMACILPFAIYKYINRPHVFKTDEERHQYVEDFAKLRGENQEREITTNEGGVGPVAISNKSILLEKTKNVDLMLITNQKVADAIKLIPTLYNDIKGLSDGDYQGYYNKNMDILVSSFGLDSSSKLKDLSKALAVLESSTIKEAKIEESSIKQSGNITKFNLILTASNGKSGTFELKTISAEQNGKTSYLVYWK